MNCRMIMNDPYGLVKSSTPKMLIISVPHSTAMLNHSIHSGISMGILIFRTHQRLQDLSGPPPAPSAAGRCWPAWQYVAIGVCKSHRGSQPRNRVTASPRSLVMLHGGKLRAHAGDLSFGGHVVSFREVWYSNTQTCPNHLKHLKP